MAGIKCTPTGVNKKVGLRPLIGATRFRVNLEYIPAPRQKQGTARFVPTPTLWAVYSRNHVVHGHKAF